MVEQAHTGRVTVSASLPSVGFYARSGFRNTGEVAESAGLVYQPMERMIVDAANGVATA
jgi:hypothetical protein